MTTLSELATRTAELERRIAALELSRGNTTTPAAAEVTAEGMLRVGVEWFRLRGSRQREVAQILVNAANNFPGRWMPVEVFSDDLTFRMKKIWSRRDRHGRIREHPLISSGVLEHGPAGWRLRPQCVPIAPTENLSRAG